MDTRANHVATLPDHLEAPRHQLAVGGENDHRVELLRWRLVGAAHPGRSEIEG
jgi:hypothetical protein